MSPSLPKLGVAQGTSFIKSPIVLGDTASVSVTAAWVPKEMFWKGQRRRMVTTSLGRNVGMDAQVVQIEC